MISLEDPILPKDDYIEAIRRSCKELYNETEKDGSIEVNIIKIFFILIYTINGREIFRYQ